MWTTVQVMPYLDHHPNVLNTHLFRTAVNVWFNVFMIIIIIILIIIIIIIIILHSVVMSIPTFIWKFAVGQDNMNLIKNLPLHKARFT